MDANSTVVKGIILRGKLLVSSACFPADDDDET